MTFINSLAQTLALQGTMTEQNKRLSQLQQQVATGQKSNRFDGLTASEARQSITLRAQLERNQVYLQNLASMTTVNAALNHSLVSLGDIVKEAHDTTLAGGIPSIGNDNGAAVQMASASALDQAIGVLNGQVAGIYLFGGRSNIAPMASAAAIQAAVRASLNGAAPPPPFTTIAGATTAANSTFATAATAGTTIQLDPTKLGNWGPTTNDVAGEPVAIGDNLAITPNIGVLPNTARNGNGVVDPYTGLVVDKSYMAMDTVRTLATLAEVKISDFGGDKNLYINFVQGQLAQLNFAGKEIIHQITASGQQGKAMVDATDSLQAQNIQLKAAISTVESVDASTAITNLQNLQTQLQATYQVTALLKNLSLVNYIQ